MKRFFILVSMVALVAAGCTKTIIKNEVETPISFSTESGKLTRAIVDGTTLYEDQPFGVYAFANQAITEDQQTTYTKTPFMPNVEITKQDLYKSDGVAGQDQVLDTWRSATGSYYWPNDPRTTINFYAYSPYIGTNAAEVKNHQKMNIRDIAQVDDDPSTQDVDERKLSFTNYTHSNMYVDFMVATPVMGATFGDPNGDKNYADADGKVPMVFHHQMTQIIFTVKTNAAYSGVNFAVESITLKNIKDKANFTHTYASNYGVWGGQDKVSGVFKIFPEDETQYGEQTNSSDYDYDFNNNLKSGETNYNASNATGKIITDQGQGVLTTVPVTMIPQSMVEATLPPAAGSDTYASETTAQVFEIVYTVAGTGVAKEKVVKHVPFYAKDAQAAAIPWGVNQKITYNVIIGLNEITFEPSVAVWDDGKTQNDQDGYNQDFTFQQ